MNNYSFLKIWVVLKRDFFKYIVHSPFKYIVHSPTNALFIKLGKV